MSFLYPAFLLALLALAIPVIIYLFNFKRYKTIFFSNVELLKRIKQESRKKSKLKQLLILIARLLAVASLVLAFSRPYIPLTNRVSGSALQVVAIYIDNTFSMKTESEKGPLLEQAKQKAIEIANSYQTGTQFLILTSDLFPEHQFLLSKEQFVQEVVKIKESPRSPKIAEIYNQVSNSLSALKRKSGKTFYLLSDYQKGNTNLESLKNDSTLWTYFYPFKSITPNNLLIDSCWFEVPGRKIGQAEKLFVSIKNTSEQAYQNIPVRLTINDSLKAISNITIDPKGETVIELNYTNNSEGIQLCQVELDDYPIIYDNSFFMSYRVLGKLNALGIINPGDEGSVYLKALFANDELVSYDEFAENNIQISKLKSYQCIFLLNNQVISSGLRNELKTFVNDGGTLVIFPAELTNYEEYNSLLNSMNGTSMIRFDTLTSGISEVNYDNELYQGVFRKKEMEADLPRIKGSVIFADQIQKTGTSLLKYRNGRDALSSQQFGDGKVYTFSFPLNKINFGFVSHVIFVPTVYNMVLNSGEHQKYAYSTENEEPLILSKIQIPVQVKIVNVQTNQEFLSSVRTVGSGKKQLNLDELPKEAGHYLIQDGNRTIQSLSYNYSREESIPEYFSEEDLQDWIKSQKIKQMHVINPTDQNFSEILQDLNNGRQLWKYFIILAVIFLFCEMAVIRFWKQ